MKELSDCRILIVDDVAEQRRDPRRGAEERLQAERRRSTANERSAPSRRARRT
jgi:hypothetical protein